MFRGVDRNGLNSRVRLRAGVRTGWGARIFQHARIPSLVELQFEGCDTTGNVATAIRSDDEYPEARCVVEASDRSRGFGDFDSLSLRDPPLVGDPWLWQTGRRPNSE